MIRDAWCVAREPVHHAPRITHDMSLDYWEKLYQTGDMRWEKGAPSPGLVDFLAAHPALPGETVCVPGGGTGHDACAWARRGFRVYGYDLAPSAIGLSQERARAAGLRVEFRGADFLRDEPPFPFDWIFEHTLFCAIEKTDRDLYVASVLRWLKPDGHFLAVHYMLREASGHGEGPPYGCAQEELMERFLPHFELLEGRVPRSYANRTGLELLLWWKRRADPLPPKSE
jgi:SAM-dependent methyltransferase